MRTEIERLYDEMIEEVSLYADMGTLPVKRYAGKLDVIHKALAVLKQFVQDHPFDNQQEEINFFKYEKPAFICELLCAQQMFSLETQRKQFNEELLIRNYYEQELKVIRHFFIQHEFLYQYFILGASELDHPLFIRGADASAVLLPENPDLDRGYTTNGDYIFAQFLAFEKVQEFLINELYPASERGILSKQMVWTGESVNLVELAYGLHLTGQLNNRRATITEIIQWLERNLNVDVGNAYRRWHSISNRKRVTPTKFIDMMRNAINKRLEDDNDMGKGR